MPDLSDLMGILRCGIRDHGMTLPADLGLLVTLADLDVALRAAFPAYFPDFSALDDVAVRPKSY